MPKTQIGSALDSLPVPAELIERRIHSLRRQRVMLDADLADLYTFLTYRLNEAVKRNQNRFPEDFMFQLTREESDSLISQFAMSKVGRGGRRSLPYAFTEQGVAMLSSVLKSDRAVFVNIAIMQAFVKLREFMATHQELAQKIEAPEARYDHRDDEIQVIFDAIKKLPDPPQPASPKRAIGFRQHA